MAEASDHGRFVWFDLFSSDPDHSMDFYKSMLGWKTQPMPGHADTDLWVTRTGSFGSVGKLEGGATVSHWLPYIAVVDVDATLAHAQDLGATLLKPSTPTGTGGFYGILQDPQGAAIGVYGPARADLPAAQVFSWQELATTDHDAAFQFYRELFGWEQTGSNDLGAMGTYLMFGRDNLMRGGMFTPPAGAALRPQWLAYVSVKDINEAARRARDAGGRIVNGPMEVPGGGDWIVQIIDPQGAAIAAHQRKAPAVITAPPRRETAKSPSAAGQIARKVADVVAKGGTSLQRAAAKTAAAAKAMVRPKKRKAKKAAATRKRASKTLARKTRAKSAQRKAKVVARRRAPARAKRKSARRSATRRPAPSRAAKARALKARAAKAKRARRHR